MKKFSARTVTEATTQQSEKSGGSPRSSYLSDDCNLEVFKFEEGGLHYLDILPIVVEPGNPLHRQGLEYDYSRRFKIHRDFKPKGGAMHLCVSKSFDGRHKCPLCDYGFEALKPESDIDGIGRDAAKKILPKDRQWFVVRDPSWDKGDFRLLDISYHLFGKQLEAALDALDENDPEDVDKFGFFSPDEGMTAKLNVLEKDFMGHKYYEVATVDFRKRAEQYSQDAVFKIEGFFNKPTLADQEEVLKTHRVDIGAIGEPEAPAPAPEVQTVPDGKPPFETNESDENWDSF